MLESHSSKELHSLRDELSPMLQLAVMDMSLSNWHTSLPGAGAVLELCEHWPEDTCTAKFCGASSRDTPLAPKVDDNLGCT
jgi:hypothetical protein